MDAKPGTGVRVHEDVQPEFKFIRGDIEDTLTFNLTEFRNEAEFKKEHLKVQIDNYGNIKVSGERPLGGLRLSRFHRQFRLPEECDASRIRATYDNKILTIVLPKLVREQAPPLPPVPTPQPAAAHVQPPPAVAPLPPPTAKKNSKTASTFIPQRTSLPAGPAVAAVAPLSLPSWMMSPPAEDRRRGNTELDQQKENGQEQGKDTTGDENSQKAAAASTKEKLDLAPPTVSWNKASDPQVRKTAGVEDENGIASSTEFRDRRQQPKQLLANVLVALTVLTALSIYLFYKYRVSRHDHRAVSIQEEQLNYL